jgi:hypothetical protein
MATTLARIRNRKTVTAKAAVKKRAQIIEQMKKVQYSGFRTQNKNCVNLCNLWLKLLFFFVIFVVSVVKRSKPVVN